MSVYAYAMHTWYLNKNTLTCNTIVCTIHTIPGYILIILWVCVSVSYATNCYSILLIEKEIILSQSTLSGYMRAFVLHFLGRYRFLFEFTHLCMFDLTRYEVEVDGVYLCVYIYFTRLLNINNMVNVTVYYVHTMHTCILQLPRQMINT